MNEKSGAFKALHSLNRLRVPWIVNQLRKKPDDVQPLTGLTLLDVGCGGGLLSIALCRLGANVVGLDADKEVINKAYLISKNILKTEQFQRIHFVSSTIEDFSVANLGRFDGVIASEILEHVSELPSFINCCVDVAKPKSKLFFTTINKTLLSKICVVWLAENIFSIVPKGVHNYNNFVSPTTLRRLLMNRNCKIGLLSGLFYNPLLNSWSWSSITSMNYAVTATID